MRTEPYHILLADDDETDRFLFMEAFEEIGSKNVVHTVNSGAALMEYLGLNKHAIPDFLFLDLAMPCKDGIECLQEIRSNPQFDKMFIAIYSSSAAGKHMEETFLNSANLYIIKPGDFTVLRQVLAKTITSEFQYPDPPFDKEKFVLP